MKDPAITLSATQGSNLQDAYDYAEVAARGERQRRTGTAEGWNAIFYKGKQLEASSLREALVKARSYAEKAGMVVEASCARDRSNAACRASGERLMADVVAFAKAGGVDATTGVPFYRPCVACGRAQDTFHAECWACREKATEAALRMRSAVGAAILRLVAEHGAQGVLVAMAKAFALLDPAWKGDDGPAVGIEAITGYAPWTEDDWRSAARALLGEERDVERQNAA